MNCYLNSYWWHISEIFQSVNHWFSICIWCVKDCQYFATIILHIMNTFLSLQFLVLPTVEIFPLEYCIGTKNYLNILNIWMKRFLDIISIILHRKKKIEYLELYIDPLLRYHHWNPQYNYNLMEYLKLSIYHFLIPHCKSQVPPLDMNDLE